MPRNVTVTLEDGSTHVYQNVPDEVTPEQVTSRAQQELGRAVKSIDGGAKSGIVDQFMRQAKLTASNLVQGAAGLPALAIDAQRFMRKKAVEGAQQLGIPDRFLDTEVLKSTFGEQAAGMQGGAEELFGMKPETLAERRAASVAQGVGGALAGPGGTATPVRTVVAGATGGIGAQIGDEVSNGNPLMRLLGGLVGGTAGAVGGNFAFGVKPQVRRIADEATEGLTPAQLKAAGEFQRRAAAEGVNLDLAQALEAMGSPSNNIRTIRDLLANSNAGNRVQQTLREQPAQFQTQADLTLLTKVPGNIKAPTEAANAAQAAATEALNRAKQARTAAVQPFYEKAGVLGKEINTGMMNLLSEAKAVPGVPQDAVEAMNAAIAKLKAAPSTGAKMDHALDYNQMIRELQGQFKGTPLTPVDPNSKRAVDRVAASMREFLRIVSPDIKEGDAMYAQLSREVVDPMKQSVVGRVATKRGYLADTEAPTAKLDALFAKGTDPNATKSDILTLASSLNKVDKDAFPNAVKTYISGKLSRAFEPEVAGVTGASEDAAQKVWKSLFADKAQYRGMKDMAAGIADAYGLPRKDVVDGLENLAQLAKALKNRPGQVGGLDAQEIKRTAGSNQAANVTRIYGFLPMERVARRIEEKQLNETFGRFDELLTTPEGAAILATIGRKGMLSPETKNLLSGWMGGASASANSPGNTRP